MPQNSELVEISVPQILMSMAPLGLVAVASYSMDLRLESPIVVGCIRSFVQLTILALVLKPIFFWGEEYWLIVIVYAFLMVLISSYESVHRCTYYFANMYLYILGCFLVTVGSVCIFTFGIIIRPDPVWEPQYVIPLMGMMLGNSINGSSLTLKTLLTSFVEDAAEIELLLSFGATSTEASSRLMREAVRTGALPILNNMAVIGLISIPGMMTGQILGGSDVMEAARYQMIIMYLLGVCTFIIILLEVGVALRVAFDYQRDMLRTDRLLKRQEKQSFLQMIASAVASLCDRRNANNSSNNKKLPQDSIASIAEMETLFFDAEDDNLDDNNNSNNIIVATYGSAGDKSASPKLKVQILRPGRQQPEGDDAVLEVANLIGSFFDRKTKEQRVIFQNLSFQVKPGEVALVSGPSGAGKSTLLRIIAGLTAAKSGSISLGDTSMTHLKSNRFTSWRRQVRYVTQYKVAIPGTPMDMVRSITSFRTATTGPSKIELLSTCQKLLVEWGMEPATEFLEEKKWTQLSGGEAQRVLVALALSSKPRVLLMDESTSALDLATKIKVEQSVKDFALQHGMSVMWVTHDVEQIERLGGL